MKVFKIYTYICLFLIAGFYSTVAYAGGPGADPEMCDDASPFCSDEDYDFPNVSNNSSGSSIPGVNTGCLSDAPNPVWYYMQIDEGGVLQIEISQSSGQNGDGWGLDVDFAMWGPFNSVSEGCQQIGNGMYPTQCSYDPASTETIGIGTTGGTNYTSGGQTTPPAAQEGEFYIVMITNWDGGSGYIQLEQTGGDGSTDCSIVIPCSIDMTVNAGSCDPGTNQFSISGELTFSDEPESGELIVEDCQGNTISFDVENISSPWSFEMDGLESDGGSCTIKAYFSDEPNCKAQQTISSPESCECEAPNISITNLQDCVDQLDLNDAVSTSDPADIVFYGSQSDAANETNAIGNIVTSSGTYWVRAVNPNDATCYTIQSVEVNLSSVSFSISKTDPSCGGSGCDGEAAATVNSGASPYTYAWTDSDGNNIGSNKTVESLCGGEYTLKVTDDNGCSETKNVILNEASEIDATFNADDFCEGAPNEITDFATPGGTFTFAEEPNDGATIDVSSGEIYNGVAGTTYTVQYEAFSGGCSNTSTKEVTVLAASIPNFEGDKLIGCEPHQVEFTNLSSGMGQNATCKWDFGDGNSITNCDPTLTHKYYDEGIYDVTLTIEDVNGCVGTLTKENYIEVIESTKADFTPSPVIASIDNPHIEFINNSQNANNYVWDFGDDSPEEYTEDVSHTYSQEEGTYIVTLIAGNDDYCYDTLQIAVKIEEKLIFYIPNAFTPDNDTYNEVFKPIFTEGFDPYDYELFIFNRWGEPLFESHNTEVGWNGMYGGKIVDDGTYIWRIEVKETKSDEHRTFTGFVTLIR